MSKRIDGGLWSCVACVLLAGCVAADEPLAELVDQEPDPWVGDDERVIDLRASPSAPSTTLDDEALARLWLRWSMALPWSTGPINDPTGSSCGWGQQGDVWFLAGTAGGPGGRQCEIPPGKVLFFPLLNGWAMIPTEPLVEPTMPELVAAVEDQHVYTCALTLRVDGHDVVEGGLEQLHDELYVELLDPFEIDVNADHAENRWDASGPMSAVTAGYFARLPPLSPGDHVLEFGGALCMGPNSFETSVTYTVHVTG